MRTLASFVFFTILSGCATVDSSQFEIFFRPEGTELVTYTQGSELLRMNVYPTGGSNPRGAILFIHGGGWQAPGPDLPLFSDWIRPLNRARLMSFSLEHRRAPDYRGNEIVEDIMKAVQFLHENADHYGFPEDKIALIGFSSGGHLAVMASLSMTDGMAEQYQEPGESIRAVVSFYAPLDPMELYESGDEEIRHILSSYLPEKPQISARTTAFERAMMEISPAWHLHYNMPPTLLIHGERDDFVPLSQSENLLRQAENLGIEQMDLLKIERGGHNFNMSRSSWARRAERQAISFVRRNM